MGQESSNISTKTFPLSQMTGQSLPVIQVIGKPEEFAALNVWVHSLFQDLHRQAFEKGREMENDPMAKYPETATAEFWARLKGKSNGERYGKRSFERFAKSNGLTREENGFWSREAGRKWLYG